MSTSTSIFNCQMCGKCCRSITIDVAYSDIMRWMKQKRYDVLYHVSYIDNYPFTGTGGFYIRETALAPKRDCPFLEDNKCGIYSTRPLACKDYPHGHDPWLPCPAWKKINYDVDEKKSKKARGRQRKSFRLAYDQKDSLIRKLVELRRLVNGN